MIPDDNGARMPWIEIEKTRTTGKGPTAEKVAWFDPGFKGKRVPAKAQNNHFRQAEA